MPKKSRKKNKSKKSSTRELNESSAVYNGPIVVRKDMGQADLFSVTLHNTFTMSSNSGSSITLVVSADATACQDWNNYSASWDEYRILGMRIEYFPNNRYSKTTVNCKPVLTVIDRVDTNPLSSYGDAMAYESAKKHSLEDPWSREVKMRGIEDAAFVSMLVNAEPFSIKFYGDNLSASTEYGRIFIYIRVQFRGRR